MRSGRRFAGNVSLDPKIFCCSVHRRFNKKICDACMTILKQLRSKRNFIIFSQILYGLPLAIWCVFSFDLQSNLYFVTLVALACSAGAYFLAVIFWKIWVADMFARHPIRSTTLDAENSE
jgi:hypothetical protein